MTRPSDEGRFDICGEPMPEGESMFRIHGYSGPCPKPPLPQPEPINWQERAERAEEKLLAVSSQLDHATTMLAAWEQVWTELLLRIDAALKEGKK